MISGTSGRLCLAMKHGAEFAEERNIRGKGQGMLFMMHIPREHLHFDVALTSEWTHLMQLY